MTKKATENGHTNGRAANGRFAPGFKGGPGRSKGDKSAYNQLRDAIRDTKIGKQPMRDFIIEKLRLTLAEGGRDGVAAAKLLLEYGWGKPRPHDDELDAQKNKRWEFDFLERGYIDRQHKRESVN